MTTDSRTVLAIWRNALISLAILLLCSASVFAEDPVCKSKGTSLRVAYPDIARRMKIAGVVRLQLQLSPTGSVREMKVLGGNPLLVNAAQQAVKQAKFEGSESCIAIFEFKE